MYEPFLVPKIDCVFMCFHFVSVAHTCATWARTWTTHSVQRWQTQPKKNIACVAALPVQKREERMRTLLSVSPDWPHSAQNEHSMQVKQKQRERKNMETTPGKTHGRLGAMYQLHSSYNRDTHSDGFWTLTNKMKNFCHVRRRWNMGLSENIMQRKTVHDRVPHQDNIKW